MICFSILLSQLSKKKIGTQAQGGKKRSVHERLGRFLFLKCYSCGAKLLHFFESLKLAHQSWSKPFSNKIEHYWKYFCLQPVCKMDRISMNYFSGLERFESHKLLQTQGCPHLSKTHFKAKYKHQRWNSFLQGHCGLQWCGHGWSFWLLLDFGKHKAAFHNLFVLVSKYFCQGKNVDCW